MAFSNFDYLPLGTLVATYDGLLRYANPAFYELLSLSAGDVMDRNVESIIVKEDVGRFRAAFEKACNDKEGTSLVIRLTDHGQGSMQVLLSMIPSDDMGGAIIQVTPMMEDANALQDTIMFDAIVNSLPDATYFKNLKSQFIKVNTVFAKKFKLADDQQLNGKTDFDLFSAEHAQQAYDDEQRIIQTGEPLLNIEEKETYEDGTVTWVSTSKMPLYDKVGKIVGTFGISRDITEQKRAETEIRLKTSILNAITAHMPVVIYRYTTQEITSLFGSSQLIRLFECSKVVRLSVKEGLTHLIEKLTQKDNEGYINFSSTCQEGEEIVYFENYVFESEEQRGEFIGLALDVTERRNSQFKLKRDAKKLEKINRELNEFAYIVSHDLKAPLRAIVNLADWIEEDLQGTLDEDVKKNLDLMKGRVHRMENLINGILQYSRVTKGARIYESVDVNELLNESIDALGIPDRFTIKRDAVMPVVTYSKMDLDRIFTNLISNVIKYHDKERGTITIRHTEDSEYDIFSVADDGPGIDPAYHEKIFKIFQTLQSRDTKESTGIGLTIVKKIVEERGGTITVESALGQGTTFTFTIPKHIATEANTPNEL